MQGSIGEIICKYRQIRNLTQEDFASRLGVTPQAVSKWERGNGLPDISLVAGICDVLGISANMLLGMKQKVVENGDFTADGDFTAENEIKNNMLAEPLVLEFGFDMIPCIMAGLETNYVNQKRKELVSRTGMLMPMLRMIDNMEMEKKAYRIKVYDKIMYEGLLEKCDSTEYGLMIDQVTTICEENYDSILNKHIVKTMIDNLKERFPGIVEGLVPEKISYLHIERNLQEMVRQKKSI